MLVLVGLLPVPHDGSSSTVFPSHVASTYKLPHAESPGFGRSSEGSVTQVPATLYVRMGKIPGNFGRIEDAIPCRAPFPSLGGSSS